MTTTDPLILTRALHGRDPLLAAEASRLIGDWNLHAFVPDLAKNLRTSRFNSKVASMYALDKLAPSEALLLEIYENPNVPDDFYWMGFKSVKTAAAIGLMKIGNNEGEGWLSELAKASDPVILRWFAPALLRLPDSCPASGLLTLDDLCSKAHRDAAADPKYTDPGQLCLLCEALGIIKDPQASEHLEHYTKFHSRFVRGQAYRSLNQQNPGTTSMICEIANREGTDFDLLVAAAIAGNGIELKRIAKEAPLGFDRASAIDALPTTGDSRNTLLEGLRDKDPYVRQCAVEKMARLEEGDWDAMKDLSQQETQLRVMCALTAVFCSRKEALC